MELLLDTVDIDEIKKYSWLVTGVTTTPTFFKREGVDYNKFIINFRKIFPDHKLFVEALGEDKKSTIRYIENIIKNAWFNKKKVILKIPITLDNQKIVKGYSKKGIRFCSHLVFTPPQAILAAQTGSEYVCPLIGRYSDNLANSDQKSIRGGSHDAGFVLLKEILKCLESASLSDHTKVMASSIRTADDFLNSVKAGADAITVPPQILQELDKHPYTTDGIKKFFDDMGYKWYEE